MEEEVMSIVFMSWVFLDLHIESTDSWVTECRQPLVNVDVFENLHK